MFDDVVAGCRTLHAAVDAGADPFPVLAIYPARGRESEVPFAPYRLSVAMDASVATGTFPLVVLSHSTAGDAGCLERTL